MRGAVFAIVLVALPAMLLAMDQQQTTVANPIRKVVNMLQMMQQKVEAEGQKEHASGHQIVGGGQSTNP